MKNELMIDIETSGQNPGCKVLTIGAFGFDRDGKQVEFYRRFSVMKLLEEGFNDDVATMDWWRTKDKEVFNEAFAGTADPKEGIADFKAWCYENFKIGKNDGFKAWCNGLDFDFPILKAFFCALRFPFSLEVLGPVRLPHGQEPFPHHQGLGTQRRSAQRTGRRQGANARAAGILRTCQGLADVQVVDEC